MTDKYDKGLTDALAQIEKAYGKGSVMRVDDAPRMDIESISTGALSLDLALGCGGVPRGRVVELFGPESSGKTTLGLHIIAEAQKAGGVCAIVDAEHALDPVYARAIGVNTKELLISQPDNGEEALEIVEMLVRSNAVAIILVDSVAALVPRAEIEGSMGDSHVGLQARLMSQAMRKLVGVMKRSNTCVIFINQIREKIGVMYGSPETTPGGRALKFYSSVRMDVRRREQIKDGTDIEGNKTEVKVVKNKVGAPFKKAEFDIMYGTGISQEGCTLDVGVAYGIVEKKGAWLAYNGSNLGQGRENSKQFLVDNPSVMAEIDRLVRGAMNNGELPPEDVDEEPPAED